MKRTRLVKFIYKIYLQKSTLHALLAWDVSVLWSILSTFFGIQHVSKWSQIRSSLEDDRPLFNNGHVDSKGWVAGLRDYVTAMKDRFPAEDHPTEDWLSKGFEMISLDQGRKVPSTPKQGTSSVGGQKSGGPASAASSQMSAMQRNLDVMTSGVANRELSSKSVHQSQ